MTLIDLVLAVALVLSILRGYGQDKRIVALGREIRVQRVLLEGLAVGGAGSAPPRVTPNLRLVETFRENDDNGGGNAA